MTIAGVPFVVEQQASSVSGLGFIGSMPHLAALENWTTTFTMVNKTAASATARLSFFGDPADPSSIGPLLLPVAFPQQATAAVPKQAAGTLSGPLLAATFDRTLTANASLIVNTSGAQVPPVLVGSAQLAATGAVDGFAIFHLIPGAQEAVVPMETRNASSYLLAFDNTGGVVLGIAVENVSAQTALIPVVIRDDTGIVIGSPGTTTFAGWKRPHVLCAVALYPATINKRGTIEFDTPAGGQISVLGIRTTPLGYEHDAHYDSGAGQRGNQRRLDRAHRYRQRMADHLRDRQYRHRGGTSAPEVSSPNDGSPLAIPMGPAPAAPPLPHRPPSIRLLAAGAMRAGAKRRTAVRSRAHDRLGAAHYQR